MANLIIYCFLLGCGLYSRNLERWNRAAWNSREKHSPGMAACLSRWLATASRRWARFSSYPTERVRAYSRSVICVVPNTGSIRGITLGVDGGGAFPSTRRSLVGRSWLMGFFFARLRRRSMRWRCSCSYTTFDYYKHALRNHVCLKLPVRTAITDAINFIQSDPHTRVHWPVPPETGNHLLAFLNVRFWKLSHTRRNFSRLHRNSRHVR